MQAFQKILTSREKWIATVRDMPDMFRRRSGYSFVALIVEMLRDLLVLTNNLSLLWSVVMDLPFAIIHTLSFCFRRMAEVLCNPLRLTNNLPLYERVILNGEFAQPRLLWLN